MPTKSAPWPTKFETLDQKAVEFMRGAPKVDVTRYAPQSGRENQDLPNQDVVVAASGGGTRAAAFTLGVLSELQTLRGKNALQEVDYFSTVSGGGWGVAAYLAERHNSGTKNYTLNKSPKTMIKKFQNATNGRKLCLTNRLDKYITQHMVFSDIFKTASAPHLPYLYANGAISPSQSPFVFTDAYVDYYRVKEFRACGKKKNVPVYQQMVPNGLGDVEVGFAVATSGSVPGWYVSGAKTSLCDNKVTQKNNPMYFSAFCSQGKTNKSNLNLVDGGIYDNIGYLTAFELFNSIGEASNKKTLIIIDVNTDTDLPFVETPNHGALKVGGTIFKSIGFPPRTAAYERTLPILSKTHNVTTVILDFYSMAGFSSGDEVLLNGLDELKEYAETQVNCFDSNGKYLKAKISKNKQIIVNSPDCKMNNYYRTGLTNKTSYYTDPANFTVMWQLGQLAVRMNSDEIYKAIYK